MSKQNGLFARTVVTGLWSRLMGRGLVEPVDNMEIGPWDRDVLDWLAADLTAGGYDLKHTIELIVTSRAYQLPATDDAEVRGNGPRDGSKFGFSGPRFRRPPAGPFAGGGRAVGEQPWVPAPPAPA